MTVFSIPNLMDFVADLACEYQTGKITSWETMRRKVFAFFTPEMMDEAEKVAPGWGNMASYSGGLTLLHVASALMVLRVNPEFKEATSHQQSLAKWIVLLHDMAKKARPEQRDFTHSFRSAAMAGENLPRLGFSTTLNHQPHLAAWINLANTAVTKQPKTGIDIQDNAKLPEIVGGIEKIFGRHAPGALVVKTILFHASVSIVGEWPQAAPLSNAEIQQYIDGELFPLLKIMMLVDSDSWSLFDLARKEKYRQEALGVFGEIERTLSHRD